MKSDEGKKYLSESEFLQKMNYPSAWLSWDMYPSTLFQIQITDFDPAEIGGGEHYRYGAFQWWLSHELGREKICKLIALSFLDPDQLMAASARADMAVKLSELSEDLRLLLALRT